MSGRIRRGDEAGVVTVFVVALMAVLVALAGLVVDGGMLLDARRRAVNEAEAAARAGAQVLTPEAVRTGGNDVAVAGAESAVRRYVAANGHDARVAVAADAVEVTVWFPQPLLILAAFGVESPVVHGTARVEAIRGVGSR
ncbi:MAG: pilus assembly protein TadG-related protein [Actinomycetota bacterium]|nr:pilus assembly protein TadG-related protein [Actinomycetota bacterium]